MKLNEIKEIISALEGSNMLLDRFRHPGGFDFTWQINKNNFLIQKYKVALAQDKIILDESDILVLESMLNGYEKQGSYSQTEVLKKVLGK